MAHVEELRQIHADINAMESIIKQSEDSRRNAQVSKNYSGVNWPTFNISKKLYSTN